MVKTCCCFFLLAFLFISIKASSQPVYLKGFVINKRTHLPVQNAVVSLTHDTTVLFKASTDSLGAFKINLTYYFAGAGLKITIPKYSEYVDLPSYEILRSKNFDLGNIELLFNSQLLKEVVIKSVRRYRDTTKIDLAGQTFQRSVMINDLFTDQMGFHKDEAGKLYYKGKLVSELKVNGLDFFNSGDMEIYKLLPALIIKDIDVTETNIDNETNATTLRPTISVNLNLKDKYSAGKFGTGSLAGGTSNTYYANLNYYTYHKTEQFSLLFNSNNLNKPSYQDPSLDFNYNQSNLKSTVSQLGYRNTWKQKYSIDLLVKGVYDINNTNSTNQRYDQFINQSTGTELVSRLKSYKIDNSHLNFKYQIDKKNTLSLNTAINYNKTSSKDSSNSITQIDSVINYSFLNRISNNKTTAVAGSIDYERKFDKPGRSLKIKIEKEDNIYSSGEDDRLKATADTDVINSDRKVVNQINTINATYTEPLSTTGVISLRLTAKNDKSNYSEFFVNDSSVDSRSDINNNYYVAELQFTKTTKKISLTQNVSENIDKRQLILDQVNTRVYNNINYNTKLDYRLNSTKSLLFNASTETQYPTIDQLTSINNRSFDPLFQNVGNLNLNPQINNKLSLSFTNQSSENTNYIFFTNFLYIKDQIGLNTITSNSTQVTMMDNIGNSQSATAGFQLTKRFADNEQINLSSNLGYSITPSRVNGITEQAKAYNINQSISTIHNWIKDILSSSSSLAFSYARFNYGENSTTNNQLSVIFNDRTSLKVKTFTWNTYTLLNINRSTFNNHTFGVNSEIKKGFLKGYGTVWIKAYDIFNTFKLFNNQFGPTYTQSSNYRNLQRYVMLGVTINFNNMK